MFPPVGTKNLDTESLENLMRCAPWLIVAEEATPEATEACRRMGVKLWLSPVEFAVCDVSYAGAGMDGDFRI